MTYAKQTDAVAAASAGKNEMTCSMDGNYHGGR